MLPALLLLVASWVLAQDSPAPEPPKTVVVAQDDSGDVRGDDHTAILEAIERLGAGGGTVEIRPGHYWFRHTVYLPTGVHLVGEPGVRFAQPAPKLVTAPAKAGSLELALDDVTGIAPGTALQLLPPAGEKTFDGLATMIQFAMIADVSEAGVTLQTPLPFDVPPDSRFGYPFKMVWARGSSDVSVTGIAFDGGKREGVPMPGHHQRTAIWIDSLFSKREGPVKPPAANAVVRACSFENFYGRGVALYNAVDCTIQSCRFAHLADEAIDFDHYCYRCRAIGNEITDALWGVAINDGSDCVVESNHLTDCDVGITIWWLPALDPKGLNERNVVRGNFVHGSREALSVLKNANHNLIEDNFLEGAVHIVENTNTSVRNVVRGGSR